MLKKFSQKNRITMIVPTLSDIATPSQEHPGVQTHTDPVVASNTDPVVASNTNPAVASNVDHVVTPYANLLVAALLAGEHACLVRKEGSEP